MFKMSMKKKFKISNYEKMKYLKKMKLKRFCEANTLKTKTKKEKKKKNQT